MIPSKRIASCVLLLLAVPANICPTEKVENQRASAANKMAKQFSTLGIHKIYVPDSCDGSRPDDTGAFFAATFSKMLAKDAKGFALESRIDAHRFLQQNNLTDCDLTRPEVVSKFSTEFSVDSMLFARISIDKRSYSMDFILINLSGTELSRFHYSEPHYADTEACFPATSSPSGWPFLFAGLDGVSQPKLVNAPNPDPRIANGTTGNVVLSAVVAADGKVDQIRVVQSLKPEIDGAAIKTLKSWQVEPFKDSNGSVVVVRVPLVVSFYHR